MRDTIYTIMNIKNVVVLMKIYPNHQQKQCTKNENMFFLWTTLAASVAESVTNENTKQKTN